MKDRKDFFKEDVFRKLAGDLHRRYYLNGNFGVSFGLQLFSEIDTDPLRGLLGLTENAWAKRKRVTVAELEQALKSSVFSWEVADFVTFVTKQSLVLKSEEEAQALKRFHHFLSLLDTIDPIFNKMLTGNQLLNWFQKDENHLEHFRTVAKSLQCLPTEYTRLPVFAYEQTGNPHAFDENTLAGVLLLQMLQELSKSVEITGDLAAVEEKNQLLNEFYLLRDDIMNYVAVQGLIAEKNGKVNQMWHQACLERCSWNIPLKEILRMDAICSFQGDKVIIIENSGIYSILIDLFPDIPMICSSGQFTYAVWQLLRKLESSNTQMYYVGDLDPEGLVMAQTLLNRFPNHMRMVGMHLHNYQIAAQSSTISDQRLKQLRLISEPGLVEIANKIIESRQTAMQEGFLDELIDELKFGNDKTR